jgi:hypothetical protein
MCRRDVQVHSVQRIVANWNGGYLLCRRTLYSEPATHVAGRFRLPYRTPRSVQVRAAKEPAWLADDLCVVNSVHAAVLAAATSSWPAAKTAFTARTPVARLFIGSVMHVTRNCQNGSRAFEDCHAVTDRVLGYCSGHMIRNVSLRLPAHRPSPWPRSVTGPPGPRLPRWRRERSPW